MRILWFSNSPSLYGKNKKNYNGGGWIESLEKLITLQTNIELAISFFHPDNCFKSKTETTTYYPISLYNSPIRKAIHNITYSSFDHYEVKSFVRVINDFKPDIIHVFGSEKSFGLVTNHTDIPVVVHIQGLLNPIKNAYFPPNYNKLDIILPNLLKPVSIFNKLKSLHFFNHDTRREEKILKNCKYLMGRTSWDKDVSQLYAPNSKYFFCNEALRDIFYNSPPWELKVEKKFTIVSTLSQTPYKGFDVILKTTHLLKKLYPKFNFEWQIFGINEYTEFEKRFNIKSKHLNIYLKGVVNSETLVKNLLESNVYVHPAYIDNSPNSVCEAQILGLPIIASNVGGIPSLIENNKNGILIPANDPYTMASKIIMLKNNPDAAIKIGKEARKTAQERHDKKKILSDLLNIYKNLSNA
ncbi:glycosyltransferase [Prolixibacteraceae bacterium Z1-6]|uniref:Glycosyltransferase n=1 Tax=Draconibacterium aestuarii TaxID=2998507 RepID=A0A9X3F2D2_9BACT|nr:glycosyltransferase [Prolixibacteraceae bacterium Z1-6]